MLVTVRHRYLLDPSACLAEPPGLTNIKPRSACGVGPAAWPCSPQSAVPRLGDKMRRRSSSSPSSGPPSCRPATQRPNRPQKQASPQAGIVRVGAECVASFGFCEPSGRGCGGGPPGRGPNARRLRNCPRRYNRTVLQGSAWADMTSTTSPERRSTFGTPNSLSSFLLSWQSWGRAHDVPQPVPALRATAPDPRRSRRQRVPVAGASRCASRIRPIRVREPRSFLRA
jgi:hypothetical protein